MPTSKTATPATSEPEEVASTPVHETPAAAPVPEQAPAAAQTLGRWSRATIAGFTLAVLPPFALIGSIFSIWAFLRSEKFALRGGTLAIAGAILGAVSAAGTVVLLTIGLSFACAAHNENRFESGPSFGQSNTRVHHNLRDQAPATGPAAEPDDLLNNGMSLDQLKQEIDNGMTGAELDGILAPGVTEDDIINQLNAKK